MTSCKTSGEIAHPGYPGTGANGGDRSKTYQYVAAAAHNPTTSNILSEEEEEGEEHEDGLAVEGNDASIAVVEVEEHEEGGDHNDHGMALHVEGVSAGSTSFQLKLMHDGHADYTSTNNVPVIVN